MKILNEILANKRQEVAGQAESLESIRDRALTSPAPPDFEAAIREASLGLIAEIKHKSPSAGLIRDPFEPERIAQTYVQAGVQAISVLMDQKFFAGSPEIFGAVRRTVQIPLLYKEFVVAEWQVWHARALGASVVLLIVAALTEQELAHLLGVCREADVMALVEVHNAKEMAVTRNVAVQCVGINNRNLDTLGMDVENTFRLKDQAPEGALLIGESGIADPDLVLRMWKEGLNGILVGEHLLKQPDLGSAVKTLMSGVWTAS